MPLAGPFCWVVLPVNQPCPLWATMLMHIRSAALPLARLYRFSISLQRCHLTLVRLYCIGSVYSRTTCQTLWQCFQFTAKPLARLYLIGFSLQTSLHWFQSTAVPLVRLYFIGFSPDTCQTLFHSFGLHSCCWSDFISLVSIYSPATYQNIALL